MTTQRRFTNPVDQPPAPRPASPDVQPRGKAGVVNSYQEISLDEVKAKRGNVLVPGYLPEGFNLSFVGTFNGVSEVRLDYRIPGRVRLMIRQGLLIRPEGLAVKAGYEEPISIGDSTGSLIRGIWERRVDSPVYIWNPDDELTLIFEMNGEIIEVGGSPGTAWTPEEIVKIAESLKPYE